MKHALFTMALVLGFLGNLFAQQPITKTSKHDFETTIAELKNTIKSMDLKIIAEVPHSKGAEMSGLELAPTHLLIFGNPKVGSLLMQKDQSIGLDLPLRMLVYEKKGNTYISYHDPKNLADTYELGEKGKVLNKMSQAMGNISNVLVE
jgi:uncharacterized protein (DUF302 family)